MCNQAKNNNDPYDIYAELARVFANGQVYLDVEPDSKLSVISNPYDLMLRTQNNISYLWDHAYYNGKYYVYLGLLLRYYFIYPIIQLLVVISQAILLFIFAVL